VTSVKSFVTFEPDGVVKEEAVRAKHGPAHIVLADVVKVTLFRIREVAVLLGAGEGKGRAGEVLVSVV
jgi:hypothetical protein